MREEVTCLKKVTKLFPDMRNCNNWKGNKLRAPFAISQQQLANCGH